MFVGSIVDVIAFTLRRLQQLEERGAEHACLPAERIAPPAERQRASMPPAHGASHDRPPVAPCSDGEGMTAAERPRDKLPVAQYKADEFAAGAPGHAAEDPETSNTQIDTQAPHSGEHAGTGGSGAAEDAGGEQAPQPSTSPDLHPAVPPPQTARPLSPHGRVIKRRAAALVSHSLPDLSAVKARFKDPASNSRAATPTKSPSRQAADARYRDWQLGKMHRDVADYRYSQARMSDRLHCMDAQANARVVTVKQVRSCGSCTAFCGARGPMPQLARAHTNLLGPGPSPALT